jgi:hypothetical protein
MERLVISWVSPPALNRLASAGANAQSNAANTTPSPSTGRTAAMTVGLMRSTRPSARSRLIVRMRPVLPPSSAKRLMIVNTAIATITGPACLAPSSFVTTRSAKLARP